MAHPAIHRPTPVLRWPADVRWIGIAGLGVTSLAALGAIALAPTGALPAPAAALAVLAPAMAFGVHLCEEFTIPGGHRDWAAAYRPERAAELTPAHLWRVNAIGALAALLVGLGAFDYTGGWSWFGIRAWLAYVFTLGENAGYHIDGTYRSSRYSPGVITACVLYLPLTFASVVVLVAGGIVDPVSVAACAVVGVVLFRRLIALSRGRALRERADQPSTA